MGRLSLEGKIEKTVVVRNFLLGRIISYDIHFLTVFNCCMKMFKSFKILRIFLKYFKDVLGSGNNSNGKKNLKFQFLALQLPSLSFCCY